MSIQDAIAQRSDYVAALRKLRKDAAAEIDRLLAFLDHTEGDPDLELQDEREPDEDAEPSLGSINPTISGSQYKWAAGEGVDLEDEHDGREPSLGSPEDHPCPHTYGLDGEPEYTGEGSQLGWHLGCRDDREGEHDDREDDPSESGIGDNAGRLEQLGGVR